MYGRVGAYMMRDPEPRPAVAGATAGSGWSERLLWLLLVRGEWPAKRERNQHTDRQRCGFEVYRSSPGSVPRRRGPAVGSLGIRKAARRRRRERRGRLGAYRA